MNLKKLLRKLTGTQEPEASKTPVIPGPAVPLVRAKKVTGRISKNRWFPNLSMRRGVQEAKERKQRPHRLAFIAESQRQGIVIARRRAEAQLRDREEGGHKYMVAFRRSIKGI